MTSAMQDTARRVLKLEAHAITRLITSIDENFESACQQMLDCHGRIIVTGMGKSGHIARKIAATLASTGTPAFFVHPAEASHGDLGMITGDDLVLALSNSGETTEVLSILPVLRRRRLGLLAMTGKPDSTLARLADLHIPVIVEEEACPHNLAPTTSTTAALAMGDAIAITLLEARGFSAEDFALSHPGGALGRRLLLRVDDIMHTGERLPWVTEQTNIAETLLEMTRKGLGMAAVVNKHHKLLGVFTDGDLRRLLDHHSPDLRTTGITGVMTADPVVIQAGRLAAEALAIMESRKINGLFVVDEQGNLAGALNMHDLLRAGVL